MFKLFHVLSGARCLFAITTSLLIFLCSVGSVVEAAPGACEDLVHFTLPGVNLEINSAKHVEAAPAVPVPKLSNYKGILPAHCRVDGVIDRRVGAGGVEYAIRFALTLPDGWNGRFMFGGGGGLNGSVRPPIGIVVPDDTPGLARGFAVVSTDTGHQGAVFDAGFFADQEATLNFLYAANGKVTRVAKALIAAYYERPADRSYFFGCSTGGREAMIMSQRYPRDFDGIVAGAPAMRTGYSNLGMRHVSVALNKVAARDANGNVIPDSSLSEQDKQLVVDSLTAACDANDDLADRMIFDVRGCDFDPHDLECRGAKTSQCLTREQAGAIATAFSGPKAADGRQVYPGYPYDTGIAAGGKGSASLPGVLHGAAGPVGPHTPATEQDVKAEAAIVAGEPSTLGNTNLWTNLNTFRGHGGKLLFYHGVSDPWFSVLDTIQYYEHLTAASGGPDATRGWSRLFLVPGMGHCSGGQTLDNFDLLTAIVNWVEHDRAPDRVIATGKAFPGRSRPLCPYPAYAHYMGSGNPEDASSFECRE